MSLVLCLLSILFVYQWIQSFAQRVQITTRGLETNGGGSWRLNQCAFLENPLCPWEGRCCHLQEQKQAFRYDSTEGYYSIQIEIKYSRSGTDLDSSDKCRLFYIIGQENDEDNTGWFRYKNTVPTSVVTSSTNLPPEADNNPIVGIKMQANTDEDDFCLFNGYVLSGIPITPAPTDKPTAVPPTNHPSNYPTRYPTMKTLQPSFVPTHYPIASESPSFVPTAQPSTPTVIPTLYPSFQPSTEPTHNPTVSPTTMQIKGFINDSTGTKDPETLQTLLLIVIIIAVSLAIMLIVLVLWILKRRKSKRTFPDVMMMSVNRNEEKQASIHKNDHAEYISHSNQINGDAMHNSDDSNMSLYVNEGPAIKTNDGKETPMEGTQEINQTPKETPHPGDV